MSNHTHLVVTDVLAQLPDFMGWLNAQVARCLNAHYGRWENFWTPEPYSRQTLADAGAVLDKLVYTLTNPVSSRLVEKLEDWPGLLSLPEDIGKIHTAKRPAWYFRDNGPVPERASGVLNVPPAFEDLSESEFRSLVKENVEKRTKEINLSHKSKKRTFLGIVTLSVLTSIDSSV